MGTVGEFTTQKASHWKYLIRLHVKINKVSERNIVHILLPISFNICFGGSKEPSH